jgi:UDP-N-acetylglucosamine 2-epimerase (non-hydrolysing)
MKIAPILDCFKKNNIKNLLVHTGQHYDDKMSGSFFKNLDIKSPDISFGIGSGTHGEQTANIILKFEKVCIEYDPSLVLVVGDVNSTLGCAIAAVKLNIPIAHVESGLRSFDKQMPEEINRVIVDRISDYLFVTEKSGMINLKNEGISSKKAFFVGNCMIDSLVKILPKTESEKAWEKYGLKKKQYILVTFHRPSNVDNKEKLKKIMNVINSIGDKYDIVFPVHPRTLKLINDLKIKFNKSVKLLEPLPYDKFLGIMSQSLMVITDSGGIQEETTYLKIKCLTVRENTERPVTIDVGTNRLLNLEDPNIIDIIIDYIANDYEKEAKIPEFWDGNAAERIIDIINEKIINDKPN